ncbi:MAG: hypothetical protein A2Y41_12885 [Spirochaetes bacterium GWB1_36_13]|nr:MAG: hypothetical protein A2Y41_12885 [Spirochaetes bacterium GWB1_36_13]
MGSKQSLFKKGKELLTNKKFLFVFIICLFLGILVSIKLLFFQKTKNFSFYPESTHLQIKPILKLFSQKQYMNITSYVETILPSLEGEAKAVALFYKGESYFKEKKYSEAWNVFFPLSRSNPEIWQALFRLGCLHALRNELLESEIIFDKIKADFEEVHYWKGFVFYQQNMKKEAKGEFLKALSYPESIHSLALILHSEGDEKQASAYYLMLLKQYPDYHEEALKYLIAYYDKNKDYHELLKYLNEWEKIYPYNLKNREKKAHTLYSLGKKQEAFDILNPIASSLNSQESYRILAEITFDLKNYPLAIQFFSKINQPNKEDKKKLITALIQTYQYSDAIQLINSLTGSQTLNEDEIVFFYKKLIQCHTGLEEWQEALKYAGILISIEDKAENYLLIAEIFKMQKNKSGYLSALKEAANRNPAYLSHFFNELLETGETDEGLTVLNTILQSTPNHEEALYFKGKFLAAQNKKEDAKIALYRLIYLPPKNKELEAEGFYLLGTILFDEDKKEEAAVFFENALKVKPDSPKVILKLSLIYLASKKYRQALEILNILKKDETLPRETQIILYDFLSRAEQGAGNIQTAAFYKKRMESLKNMK